MKKVAVFLAEGFEEIEALTVVDIMRRANVYCDMVATKELEVKGAHNIFVKADRDFGEDLKDYDLIVFPGGLPGATNLRDDKRITDLAKYFYENNKLVAAICAAPIVLAKADIITGRNITSYPGFEEELKGCNYTENKVEVDGNIITSRGPATAMEFAYKLLEVLGEESYKTISAGMLYK